MLVVIEIMTFRLAVGVDESMFRAVDERVQVEFAYHQPGFLRRTLGRHDDGRWLVLRSGPIPRQQERRRRHSTVGLAEAFRSLLTDSIAVERFDGVG